jgi:hypothetical protein
MGWMDFTSSLVGHLAWPIAFVVVMVLFRKPLTALLAKLRTWKGFGTEATFGEALAAAEPTIEAATAEMPQRERQFARDPERDAERDNFIREIEANPSFGIIAAWERIQWIVTDMSATVAVATGKSSPPRTIAQQLNLLTDQDAITTDLANGIRELQALRNEVAHASANPTPGQALAYAENAWEIEQLLFSIVIHPSFRNRFSDESSTT